MTIDLTREDWLEAQARLERLEHDWQKANPGQTVDGPPVEDAVEAVLGPCPPKPMPEPLLKDGSALMLVWMPQNAVPCWVGVPGQALHPDEADTMAAALVEHAAYARKQEALSDDYSALQDEARERWKGYRPVAGPLIPAQHCGRFLGRVRGDTADPICQRPKGHAGPCTSTPEGLSK